MGLVSTDAGFPPAPCLVSRLDGPNKLTLYFLRIITEVFPVDKILSARLDESVVNRIGSLARRLHTSKKKIIETAIEAYAAQVDKAQDFDVFEHTCGAWRRKESARETVAKARKAFQRSVQRHQP